MFCICLQFVLKERIASRQIGAGEILTGGFGPAPPTSARIFQPADSRHAFFRPPLVYLIGHAALAMGGFRWPVKRLLQVKPRRGLPWWGFLLGQIASAKLLRFRLRFYGSVSMPCLESLSVLRGVCV
jgi:hypothetical protein